MCQQREKKLLQHQQFTLSPQKGTLFGAKNAIPGIAKARHDITVVIQMAVHRRRHDRDVRVRLFHPGDPFRRGQKAEETDLLRPGLLQQRDRRGAAAEPVPATSTTADDNAAASRLRDLNRSREVR